MTRKRFTDFEFTSVGASMGVSFKDNELDDRKQILNEYELVDLMNELAENNMKIVDDHSEEIIQLERNITQIWIRLLKDSQVENKQLKTQNKQLKTQIKIFEDCLDDIKYRIGWQYVCTNNDCPNKNDGKINRKYCQYCNDLEYDVE